MNWIIIAIIALAVIIAVLVIIKICLRKRLDNIDGMHGVFTTDQNKENGTVIGMAGDEKPGEKR